MKKLIVIPTFNERENIRVIVPTILSIVPDANILVVDDGSPDGTAQEVKILQTKHPQVSLLERASKEGLGRAYIAGFDWALKNGFEFVVEMDADWSHPPRFLPVMFKHAERADFVIGSRYVRGGGTTNWNWFRKLISRFGSLYARLILGVQIRDFTGGFNGWHSRVLKSIGIHSILSDGYTFQIEMKYRAVKKGFKYIEFPIVFEERREGQSKMSSQIVTEAMRKVWLIRFST